MGTAQNVWSKSALNKEWQEGLEYAYSARGLLNDNNKTNCVSWISVNSRITSLKLREEYGLFCNVDYDQWLFSNLPLVCGYYVKIKKLPFKYDSFLWPFQSRKRQCIVHMLSLHHNSESESLHMSASLLHYCISGFMKIDDEEKSNTTNVRMKVTLRRVRVTILIVENR